MAPSRDSSGKPGKSPSSGPDGISAHGAAESSMMRTCSGLGSGVSTAEACGWTRSGWLGEKSHMALPQYRQKLRSASLAGTLPGPPRS